MPADNEPGGKLEPDPLIEAYKRDIDRTLIRENLKLTVEQRFAEELRRAGREARRSK